MSAVKTLVVSPSASSARPWARTMGSLSTWATRAAGFTCWAISWTLPWGGKPGPDVDELVDPGLGEVGDGPLEEPAVLPGGRERRTPPGSLVQLVGGRGRLRLRR